MSQLHPLSPHTGFLFMVGYNQVASLEATVTDLIAVLTTTN